MGRLPIVTITMLALIACGGSQTAGPDNGSDNGTENGTDTPEGEQGDGGAPVDENQFQLQDSDTAGQARGEHPSEIEATDTHAAMRLFVVDRDEGPIQGIVIKMTAPDGTPYYTDETDSVGYAEVLVPVGQTYQIEYLSLGRRNVTASVPIPEGPNQDIRLTMRYRRIRPEPEQPSAPAPAPQPFVLHGVLFGTGSATIQEESYARLDRVVEYMTHMTTSRIRIAGHTDNVGNPQRNQALSESRAEAVREYIISAGIHEGRIEAVGYGDQQPVASNDTDDGRRQNRRIEAHEL